nr:zinc knuckle CX2CX4HX4C [Tanacetum cinerariifolium]
VLIEDSNNLKLREGNISTVNLDDLHAHIQSSMGDYVGADFVINPKATRGFINPSFETDNAWKSDASGLTEGDRIRADSITFGLPYCSFPPHQSNVDVSAIFGVSLTTVGDLEVLITVIDAGKHEGLLCEMTNDKRTIVFEALGAMCDLIEAQSTLNLPNDGLLYSIDDVATLFGMPFNSLKKIDEFTKDLKVGKYPLWSTLANEPIVQSVAINTKLTSYAGVTGVSAKDQPTSNSNFHPLVVDHVFDGVNISISHKVIKKAKHGLKRIMMNSKGFFFFKSDSRAGLEAVLEGGPWSSFARCLIKVNSEADLVDVVTIGIPSLTGNGFTKETIRVVSPPIVTTSNIVTHTVEKTNDGFQMVGKKRKGKSKSTNGVEFSTGTSSKKGNKATSNSYFALENEEAEEDDKPVENVFDESANLFPNLKTGEISPFTATVG